MERISDLALGLALVKAVGAEPTRILDLCVSEGIEFWGAYPEDEFTLLVKIRLRDVKSFLALSERSCCELELVRQRGAPVMAKRAKRRYVMWVLPLCLLALFTAASFFIWDIEISGNQKVSDTEILNALEDAGVYIGSFHPSFTSDNIRSRVLVKIPELKFISVSVFGSRACIEVRERSELPKLYDETEKVKLIAEYPGIINRMNIYRGFSAALKGQTVAMGDTLVDGAVPSSFGKTVLTHARGEVEARTWHEILAFAPMEYTQKHYTGGTKRKYAILLGDKRINFYRNSGILSDKCDIITDEWILGVDGVFSLPIKFICQSIEEYELVPASYTEDNVKQRLEGLTREELLRRLGKDGEAVSEDYSFSLSGGYGVGTLRTECRQNIAAEKKMTEDEINAALADREEQKSE